MKAKSQYKFPGRFQFWVKSDGVTDFKANELDVGSEVELDRKFNALERALAKKWDKTIKISIKQVKQYKINDWLIMKRDKMLQGKKG